MFDQIIVFAALFLALGVVPVGLLAIRRGRGPDAARPGLDGCRAANEAFAGFGHAAVVAVAGVLAVSRGLRNSGVVDTMARLLSRVDD